MADPAYRDVDEWILARCATVADDVAEHMDEYRYDSALREVREFVWHDLADDYLELIKGRLYEGRPGERDAARQALATALRSSLTMLSPFAPFLTEEAWDALPGTEGSVHASEWPDIDTDNLDEEAEAVGAIIADVAASVRGWKSDEGLALNEDLAKVEVYPEETPESPIDTYDLSEVVNAPVVIERGVPTVELVPVEIDVDHSIIGPEFRDKAGAVVAALEAMDPAEVQGQIERNGEIEVDLGAGDGDATADGADAESLAVVPGDAVSVLEEHRAEGGEEVAVVEGATATILVYP